RHASASTSASAYMHSNPPRLSGLLCDDDLAEVCDRLLETFGERHERIFVLDAQDAVVTVTFEHGDKRLPERIAMTVPAGSERPRAMFEIVIRPCIVVAVARAFMSIKFRIFGVNVKQQPRFAKFARSE